MFRRLYRLGVAVGADADNDTYTLARVMHSEFASGTKTERAAIAWATINAARDEGMGVTEYAQRPFGTYGSQEEGRPVSTAREPNDSDFEIARRIMAGQIPDPTYGATRFFDPRAQDAMHAKWLRRMAEWEAAGRAGEKPKPRYLSADEIVAKWTREGHAAYTIPGARAEELVFFRRGDVPLYASASGGLAALALGGLIVFAAAKATA